ncbi:SPOSA6832_03796, partial [Sporobolomyces salmonicolor]
MSALGPSSLPSLLLQAASSTWSLSELDTSTFPWDHSFRLEHKLGPRLKVVAIIDPATSVAQAVLDRKRNSFVVSAYAETRICASLDEFVETMKEEDRPHAFIVGSPPAFRGSIKPGRDFEVQVLRHFPNNTPAMFLEKPLSTDTPEEAGKVARMLVDSRTILSVGYFLRYLKGLLVFIFSGSPHPLTTLAVEVVQTMRKILEDNNLEVVATIARYASSYAFSTKHAWWMKSKDCGPIVEQATHFVDLSRYFGGEVDLASVQAQQLDWDEPAGELSVVPVDEKSVEPADRIPRVTSACWKYENGAVGTLVHTLALQGYKYSCELEVYADGYQLKLIDPYNAPELRVRTPHGDEEQIHKVRFGDSLLLRLNLFTNPEGSVNCSPRMTHAFIDATEAAAHSTDNAIAEDDEETDILSSYEDACKTYAFNQQFKKTAAAGKKK